MNSYFDGMLRSFEFSGRSTRMQYWMFFLVQMLMIGVGVGIDYQLGGVITAQMNRMPVTLFMMFIHLAPGITVQVRRLHDIDKSGAWLLLQFVPFGGLVLLYWACQGSAGTARIEPSSRAVSRSSIPRGVRMGNTLVAGRQGPAPVEGRFI